ncbi:hypothetical protein MMC21_005049 [Puttea exsequens]|nr:hypothetical protein [Puttea exsequens]
MADTVSAAESHAPKSDPSLDLSRLPPIYVLAAHVPIDELHEAEDFLVSHGANLTYDIKEANIVLGNILRARRAKSELQWKGLLVVDVKKESPPSSQKYGTASAKRRKLSKQGKQEPSKVAHDSIEASTTESDVGDDLPRNVKSSPIPSSSQTSTSSTRASFNATFTPSSSQDCKLYPSSNKMQVISWNWLKNSMEAGKLLHTERYVVYEGKLLRPAEPKIAESAAVESLRTKPGPGIVTRHPEETTNSKGIVERAQEDPKASNSRYMKSDRMRYAARRDTSGKAFSSSTPSATRSSSKPVTRPTHLMHQTTSEHDEAVSRNLPSMPDWVREGKIYACERAAPLNCPNEDLTVELKKIRLARVLTLDEIGVRAYSTVIAAIAAYPHRLQSTSEILALPGCDQKIAHLFHEFKTSGQLQAVKDLEADCALRVLREFYDIWGVGAKTAREFYYDKGWRDLDDIVEHGWTLLTRSQQIGLKYYDEFQLKIPRVEVETITAVITRHAKLVTDTSIETIIVGGYRRGKPESGDVDVILSHQNEDMTCNLVERVVKSLEKEGWITHTLTMNLTNTKRNQEPLPISTASLVGHGFDTLDKALVVWQDPNWETKSADLSANPKAKNPNPHRRVDIIISPWRTVGCAIAGWTSGTTFQRDLRRYAKYRKRWKFDSSGVRERGTGRWVDLEGWRDKRTRCTDWKAAERRVFEGMGLVYREPWDRCTG